MNTKTNTPTFSNIFIKLYEKYEDMEKDYQKNQQPSAEKFEILSSLIQLCGEMAIVIYMDKKIDFWS